MTEQINSNDTAKLNFDLTFSLKNCKRILTEYLFTKLKVEINFFNCIIHSFFDNNDDASLI